MPKHSQRHSNYGKSEHLNINIDNNVHCDDFKDVYVPGEFENPDTSINVVSLEQYDQD